ncbi:hypothetical protein BD311DRAFT_726243 [Dichomitus squalens]|uniref:GYF domain-containing protein n=1 Tax=Dichomitus squalens TaxID=114155 RepID=A0A4Q9MG12_9APHY|nr:hypothetical protein BD311DRAFT_726243 [Dichomitus squalens]
MTATTMHFGPEWMRTKQGSSRPAPSPPLTSSPAPPGNSTYSALVTPASNPPPEGRDVAHPFRYSKEEMLRIYKEGGGRGGLGLEVERWEGIVREVGYEPVGLKEMSEAEKKLFAGPLNSEVRRRQSTDFLSPLNTSGLGERPKLNHVASGAGSPMRERIGSFMGRRRGDSTDQAPLSLPRKLSLSNMQGALASPREGGLPSPRVRPGFDGVLSETWSARRRTSENVPKVGGKSDKETDGDSKDPDIKEEEEDALGASDQAKDPSGGTSHAVNGNGNPNGIERVNEQLGNVSISGQQDGQPQSNQPNPAIGDLSAIEWSYLDPQGNIQGPFKADIMQRWYNEGYFQPTLLMKRTNLDTNWTPVGELVLRVGEGQPVFLSPLVLAVTPPGLSRPLEHVVDRAVPERDQNSPYQPVPTRSIRSSTLDSYLQNGSNASDSPSSSIGGRFVNGSPDPSIFENRHGAQIGFDHLEQSRMPFATPGAAAIGTPGQRRATLNEPIEPVLGTRYGIGRTPGADGLSFSGPDGPGVFNESTFRQRIVQESGALNGLGGSSALNGGTEFGPIGGIHANQATPSRVLNRDPFGRPPQDELQQSVGIGGSFSNHSSPFISHAPAAFPQTPLSQFAGQDNRSLHSITPDRQSIPYMPQLQQQQFAQSPGFANGQSPWQTHDVPAFTRRPGPFDANHPTSSNTFVSSPIAPSHAFGRAPQMPVQNDQSPWRAPAQPVQNDSWGAQTASLTIANLGQHNEQQRQADLQRQSPRPAAGEPAPAPEREPAPAEPQTQPQPVASTPVAAPSAPSPTDVAPQKPRRKSTAQTAPTASPAPKAAPPAPAPAALAKPPSPPPQAEPKAPWAIDDDKKKQGAAPTLREIQEAEAKKLEARKAEQRERERAERAARVSSQSEDFQPFTTSWGLPTSQAGARSTSVKESPVASPFSGSAPAPAAPVVWTNAAKVPVAKKTMKEIQEEEERKRKQAREKEKETVAAAARRAHADTTTKPAAATPPSGGAWTTVGASGKVAAATPAGTARPVATPAASAKVVPTVSVVVAPSSSTSRPTTATVARPAAVAIKSTPSRDESTSTLGPSLEFLKWLGDSLKGLNNSVNLEELTSMLLSFPLDPDPITVEIISDLIYASSTTLDGRRFAAEFVSKRKADATSRPKGASASSAAKPISIADVVKTQPKPAQNEWGGFKVVNKKKKGGRS